MSLAFVQKALSNFAVTSSQATAYASNVTAGDLLVVAVHANVNAVTFGISDTRGNSWTLAMYNNDAGAGPVAIWFATANSSGACTVTVTSTGSPTMATAVLEYSGFSTWALDTTHGEDVGSGPPDSTGAVSTATANEVLVGIIRQFAGGQTALTGTFTLRESFVSGGTTYVLVGDLLTSSSGSYAMTDAGTSGHVSALAAIKQGAVTGGRKPVVCIME